MKSAGEEKRVGSAGKYIVLLAWKICSNISRFLLAAGLSRKKRIE